MNDDDDQEQDVNHDDDGRCSRGGTMTPAQSLSHGSHSPALSSPMLEESRRSSNSRNAEIMPCSSSNSAMLLLDRGSVNQSPASSIASDGIPAHHQQQQQHLKYASLRLNAQLAADPALQPDAKDLKAAPAITIKTEQEDHHHQHHHYHRSASASPIAAIPILKSDLRDKPKIVEIAAAAAAAAVVPAGPRIPVFMCAPCGIRFSSLSTLEAHQTYYCSHRKDADEPAPSSGGGKHGLSTDPTSSSGTTAGGASANASLEPPAKAIRTGKQYACTQCSYSADKKVSLNRHMRMHQTSPAPSSNASNGGGGGADLMDQQQQQQLVAGLALTVNHLAQVDRYCSNCDIRFNSTKTYRAHKQHYCSSRHRDG